MKLEELADSLDEQWSMLADMQAEIEALRIAIAKKDATLMQMLKHCERLVRDKEDMMRAIGIYNLVMESRGEK